MDAYKGEKTDSIEGRIVSNMKEILPQLEELYAEALSESRNPYRTDRGKSDKASETNVQMDRQPVNVIHSMYGLDNPKQWIKNQIEEGKEFVLYNEKEANSFLQTYGYSASVGEGIKPLSGSIPSDVEKVNKKFYMRDTVSDRDPDAGKRNRILQKQNAELKDTVEYLRELVRLQGKVTDGTVYTRGSVELAAKRMMKAAGAKGDSAELTKIQERTYKAMGEGSEEMTGLIDAAAQWLVEHQTDIIY